MRRRPARLVHRILIAALLVLLLVLLLVSGRSQALAQDPAPAGGIFRLHANAAVRERGEMLQARAETAIVRVAKSLGCPTPRGPIALHIASTDGEYQAITRKLGGSAGPAWALALAYPGRDTIVVRLNRTRAMSADSAWQTLDHELAHLVLHEAADRGGRHLPRWLDEGLASWAAGRRLGVTERVALAGMVRSRELPRLEESEHSYPASQDAIHILYLQSLAYVEWFDRKARERDKSLADLIDELETGATVDQAMFRVVPITDPELEWRYALLEEVTWLDVLLASGTLWQLISVLAILAILRHVWQIRKLRRRLSTEDEVLASLDDEDSYVEPDPVDPFGDEPGDDEPWRESLPEPPVF